jgi:hypothetical protein
MKVKHLLFAMGICLLIPMLAACGAPNTGAKDVISPAEHKQHEISKEKHETS